MYQKEWIKYSAEYVFYLMLLAAPPTPRGVL